MSFSPKSAEPVAADPLGEALDRLEASIAGSGAIPAPRPKGVPPKAIVPEGAVAPSAVPKAANGVQPAARNGKASPLRSEPVPTPKPAVVQTPTPVPRPAKATAPAQIETWSGRAVGERPIQSAPPEKQEAPVVARESAPLAKPTAPTPQEFPEQRRGRADTQPLAEDDFVPYFENGEAEAVSIRKGNRRVSGSPWRTIGLVLVSQVAVVAIAAVVAWPILQRELAEQRAASAGAAGVVGAGVAPAAVAEIDSAELDVLRGELAELRKQMSATPGDAWKELEYLRERNRLLELGDRAIDTADREAFDKLVIISGGASDDRLRAGAVAEVLRVRFAYTTGIRSESHTLPVGQLFPSLRGKSEMELSTDQLVEVLLDLENEAADRTKAAYLLADRRGGKAADALAKAVAEDKNLDVVREAAMTFSEMTGYRSANLLDTGRLGKWWEVNAARVKAVVGD